MLHTSDPVMVLDLDSPSQIKLKLMTESRIFFLYCILYGIHVLRDRGDNTVMLIYLP